MLQALVFLFALSLSPLSVASAPASRVNAVGCSLFDMRGKLLKKYLGWVCGFFPNGKMLLGDGFTLTFYDEKMSVVWSRDVHTHHMITYSPHDRTALVIASNILHGDTRSDRLEVYDIEGKLLKAFDFTPEHSRFRQPQRWDLPALPGVKEEITLVESFYRVPRNQSKAPFLSEGNYLAYEATGMIYFFDKSLRGIVHKIDLRSWGLSQFRDLQVTKEGHLLLYNSGHHTASGQPFTALEERDPRTGRLVWQYKAKPPETFFGSYEGNVEILPSGNLLYSVVMDELKGESRRVIAPEQKEPWMEVQGMHRSFEITRAGKTVWSMVNDGNGLSGMPNVAKRLDLSEYYRKKKRY